MTDFKITKEVIKSILDKNPEIINLIDERYRELTVKFYVEDKKPKELEPLFNGMDPVYMLKKIKDLFFYNCVVFLHRKPKK